MKKFLAILLIAIVACSTETAVEEEVFDFKALIKKAVELLKEYGLWDPLVALLKNFGLNIPFVDENGEHQLKITVPKSITTFIGDLIVQIVFYAVWEGGKWVIKNYTKVIGHK